MIAVAISILFGFVAFAALLSAGVSLLRGVKHGRAILCELAELDAAGISRPHRAPRAIRRPASRLQPVLV